MTSPSVHPRMPQVSGAMLKDVGLFHGLDDTTLRLLAAELRAEPMEIGHTVIREGEVANDMFIVIGGELEVTKQGRETEVRVALLGPGDWFGEMTVLEVQPRSATVRTVAPTLLLRVTAEAVEKLLYERDIKLYATFMTNIARELSRRLRVADGVLVNFFASLSELYTKPKSTATRNNPG